MCDQLKLHEIQLPAQVVMGECWARDGLQNERTIVPTDHKVEMIAGLAEAGFPKIEATSFAHPKYLPQFADAEEVLKRIPRKPGVEYRGICTTMKGIERAMRSKDAGFGVDEIAMVISSTEEHNLANVNMTHDENKRLLEEMTRASIDSGHAVFGWVLTSFGCPITGDVPLDRVARMGKWWKDIGARYVGFGDTTGASNPRQVSQFYEYVLAEGFTPDEIVVHFHDTRGWGVANSLIALSCGLRYFDSSIGAIGGQPRTGAAEYHHGYAGNTCTEDLVGMFEEMGVRTGIDVAKMLQLGRRAEEILGRRLRSNFIDAGPVPHRGIVYDKEKGIIGVKG
ncbi:MAG: hydroxymethylglutaryl-CoA lyase [Deltaproteobacteria bacterium]|nr:hydroxymethylglutaryl-CoA lyase [Deltaproteobacteria bacterium]